MSGSKRFSRLRRVAYATMAVLALAITPTVVSPAPAEAAPVAGFNAGNIISDSLFYNGSTMTAAQVQTFLNQQLSSCKIGAAPYLPGALSPSGSGNIIASACLKNFKQTTSSRAADAYCSGYVGAANETAAQIIAKVGQACGISQKVLLVMLEKEQSLVTDSWPVTRQFNYALGMNCPDSGPGNSANCDSASAGFALQLYLGARQLKVYKANPNSFNYKPFQNNKIQWHPSTSCGTSTVYIENSATAALYIYTPYRPNQAALNAGWGTGDGCSSYGNRNFYLFYTSWFGATTSITVDSALKSYFDSLGGTDKFGQPNGAAVRISGNGGGVIQDFERGRVTYSTATSTFGSLTSGPFLVSYLAAGGPAGSWGWLTSGANCGLVPSGCVVSFQNGLGAYSTSTGVVFVPSAVSSVWQANGSQSGVLGYPTAPAIESGTAVFQKFESGSIVAGSGGGYRLGESLTQVYLSEGGVSGLGTISNASVSVSASRSYVGFAKATLFIDTAASTTVRFGSGPFLTAYLESGGPSRAWGWPLSGAVCGLPDSGCTMEFENGAAVYSSSTGAQFVATEQFEKWVAAGGAGSNFGYPVAGTEFHKGGTMQAYKLAYLLISEHAAVRFGSGPFLTAYLESGGPSGAWGWPLSGAVCGLPDSGCTMEFENGAAVYSSSTGAQFVATEQFEKWVAAGGAGSNFGYPVAGTEFHKGGTMQAYKLAYLLISEHAAVRFGSGPFLTAYLESGGPSGAWGWPLSGAVCGLPDSGCTMEFENVAATYTKSKGVKVA